MVPQNPDTQRDGDPRARINNAYWYRAASAFVAIVLLFMVIMESGSPLGLRLRLCLASFFLAEAFG